MLIPKVVLVLPKEPPLKCKYRLLIDSLLYVNTLYKKMAFKILNFLME